jgi:hypothetical protein
MLLQGDKAPRHRLNGQGNQAKIGMKRHSHLRLGTKRELNSLIGRAVPVETGGQGPP